MDDLIAAADRLKQVARDEGVDGEVLARLRATVADVHSLRRWLGNSRHLMRPDIPAVPGELRRWELTHCWSGGCTVEGAAREFGLEEAWAREVVAGIVEAVHLPHVQQVCEAWSCTPYDFWGAETARTIVHAYPPELWPRHIAPLCQGNQHRLEGGGLEPPGPELGP